MAWYGWRGLKEPSSPPIKKNRSQSSSLKTRRLRVYNYGRATNVFFIQKGKKEKGKEEEALGGRMVMDDNFGKGGRRKNRENSFFRHYFPSFLERRKQAGRKNPIIIPQKTSFALVFQKISISFLLLSSLFYPSSFFSSICDVKKSLTLLLQNNKKPCPERSYEKLCLVAKIIHTSIRVKFE